MEVYRGKFNNNEKLTVQNFILFFLAALIHNLCWRMINLKKTIFTSSFFIDFYIFITKNKKPKQPPTPHKLHLCLLVKKRKEKQQLLKFSLFLRTNSLILFPVQQ